jgi:hypothetical protein
LIKLKPSQHHHHHHHQCQNFYLLMDLMDQLIMIVQWIRFVFNPILPGKLFFFIFQARNIFQQIYSNGEEFLARAPDPEDIIIEDDSNTVDTTTTNTDNETSWTFLIAFFYNNKLFLYQSWRKHIFKFTDKRICRYKRLLLKKWVQVVNTHLDRSLFIPDGIMIHSSLYDDGKLISRDMHTFIPTKNKAYLWKKPFPRWLRTFFRFF